MSGASGVIRTALLLLMVALTTLVTGGCADSPQDEYAAFRERTKHYRPDGSAVDAAAPVSQFADLRGQWLLNAALAGGIAIGLRVIIEGADEAVEAPPARLTVKIWLHDQPEDAPALVITETEVDAEGRFAVVADPLDLPGEALNREEPVRARVVLEARTPSSDEFCGIATGTVTSPLTFGLEGSTFYASRDPEGNGNFRELPFRCPAGGGSTEPDAGPETDGGPPGDGGVPRPDPPDLSAVPSRLRDLTGHYILNARLAGALPLELWLAAVYAGGPDGGQLDGALRRADDPITAPPLVRFSALVDADGRFEIWLPAFSLVTSIATVEADILLAAATTGVGFCGEAAGQVSSPIQLDLAGTTYAATPWVPGAPKPSPLPSRCAGDAPQPDAGAPDAGLPDAGLPDAAGPDAGATDQGLDDATR